MLAYAGKHEDKEIIEGVLSCKKCSREYKIIRGVPHFAEFDKTEQEKIKTAENIDALQKLFTSKLTNKQEHCREQFLDWLQPVKPEFFKDKIVLEGGCGKGSRVISAASLDAEEVVGIDLSSDVEIAFQATKHLPNAHIVQGDIFKLPLKKVFDYAFSIGVLHHTPEPKKAFVSMASKVKKGGAISAWVYGAENNRWIARYLNPLRENLNSKIKQPTLYKLSTLPTLGVFLASKLIYKPVNAILKPVAKHLIYNDYLKNLGKFGWREQHNIVFDQLAAPKFFYISKNEFEDLWKEIGAKDVEIIWRNRNSWCGFGRIE
ncbi:MAG: hypothetical protein JWN60_95 [Acidobacteria bacterium]|nr:hypothetical protein [Acidobacteriota bacterium]